MAPYWDRNRVYSTYSWGGFCGEKIKKILKAQIAIINS